MRTWLIDIGNIGAWDIAQPLLLTMLIPLALGLVLHAAWEEAGDTLNPFLGPISNIALVGLPIATFVANWSSLTGVFGEWVLLAELVYIALCFGIGYLLGGDMKPETGFGTAQRNIAAANVVAITTIGNPDTIVSVVVISMAAMVILFPVATWFGKREGSVGETGLA